MCFVVDRTLSVQLGKPNGRQWEAEAGRYAALLRGENGQEGVEEKVVPSSDDIFVAALTVSVTTLVSRMVY